MKIFDWLYRLLLRFIGKQSPRKTNKRETEEVLRLHEKYKRFEIIAKQPSVRLNNFIASAYRTKTNL